MARHKHAPPPFRFTASNIVLNLLCILRPANARFFDWSRWAIPIVRSALSLDISVRTVEVHRFNLMRRLNVRNVAQLLRQALQQNLLPRNFGSK